MKTERRDRDVELKRWMRRGDPAEGEPPLTAREAAGIKQEILAAVEEGPLTGSGAGWRWAAVVACAVILGLIGWSLRDPSVPTPSTPRVAQASPETTEQDEVDGPPRPRAETGTVDTSTVPSTPPIEERSAPAPLPALVAQDSGEPTATPGRETPPENLQARTLRFTTRRGTQIIWILDPELEL
jgi:hypothetical protein